MQDTDYDAPWAEIAKVLKGIGPELAASWHFGDGNGGAVLCLIMEIVEENGVQAWSDGYPSLPTIPARFRIEAMERDGLKCVYCGSKDKLRCARLPHAKGLTVTDAGQIITLCTSHVWAARKMRVDAAQKQANRVGE